MMARQKLEITDLINKIRDKNDARKKTLQSIPLAGQRSKMEEQF